MTQYTEEGANAREPEIQETVGVFDSLEKLDLAVSELESTEFPRQDISVLGDAAAMRARFGDDAIRAEWLEDHPDVPRGVSVRPEERVIGGALLVGIPAYLCGCVGLLIASPASSLVLLGATALGSLIGAAIGGGILYVARAAFLRRIDRQISKGGLLLWVRTTGPRKQEAATTILNNCGARHVHVHSIH